jgi:hypothetical protein
MTVSLRRGLAALACLLPLLGSLTTAQGAPPSYARRWVYARSYLFHASEADALVNLINRAAAGRYNAVVLSDWGLNNLGAMPPQYFDNLRRVQAAAAAARVEIIPAVFPVGYSEPLLKDDPNLAEGLPVVNAPFVVGPGGGVPVNAGVNAVVNGGFEQVSATGVPAGFGYYQADPNGVTGIDTQVAAEGTSSFRLAGGPWLTRVYQACPVRPYTSYRVSAWVRTANLTGTYAFNMLALTIPDNRTLNFHPFLVQPDQGWTKVSTEFNSQGTSSIGLHIGLWWANLGGTAWVDDLRLEEIGPINVLRRPGCPVRVTSADGGTVYQEGVDYQPLVDPLLGQVPYAGLYSYDHAAPALRLTAASRIAPGQRLLVSWYHPPIIYGYQVTCCLDEPKVYDLLREQARRVVELLRPRTVLMGHDEIRVANWCQACRGRGLSAGDLLADHTARCVQILRQLDPTLTVAVWSDMYDPTHNAVKDYYLVAGDLAGSWKGLDPQVTVLNWHSGVARESLSHFAGLGMRQVIAGYYDTNSLADFTKWDAAAVGIPRVDGFMYTTWYADYSWLQAYGTAIRRLRICF